MKPDDNSQLREELLNSKRPDKFTAKQVIEIELDELEALLDRYIREARRDELHKIGESMLTTKGLMWVIARNRELKGDSSNG